MDAAIMSTWSCNEDVARWRVCKTRGNAKASLAASLDLRLDITEVV
jgi:hypothetical protein